MDERIYELLNDEIEARFTELSELDSESEAYSDVLSNIKDLYKLRIEDRKLNIESLRNATEANLKDRQLDNENKRNSLEIELKDRQLDNENKRNLLEIELKDRQLAQNADQLEKQSKDNYLKMGIEVAGMVLPLIFYASWMKKGLKFEETGAFTSTTFKGLISKFKPTSK